MSLSLSSCGLCGYTFNPRTNFTKCPHNEGSCFCWGDRFGFEHALHLLRQGVCVHREGWAKCEFAVLTDIDHRFDDGTPRVGIIRNKLGNELPDDVHELRKYLHEFTQGDILADDWMEC